jgi:quinol monooxygenase YgiN
VFALPDPNQVQLVAVLTAKTGQEAQLRRALHDIIPMVKAEPGCIEYAMHVDRQDQSRIVMFEIWADQAALDAHGAAPAFQSLAARFGELLAEPPSLTRLQRIG